MANKKKPRAATKPTVRMTKIEFFDNVSGRLEIHEDSDGEFSDCELRANAIDTKTKNFRRLTAAELDSVVFRGKQIRLRGMAGKVVSHDAPNGNSSPCERCRTPSRKRNGELAAKAIGSAKSILFTSSSRALGWPTMASGISRGDLDMRRRCR